MLVLVDGWLTNLTVANGKLMNRARTQRRASVKRPAVSNSIVPNDGLIIAFNKWPKDDLGGGQR